MERRRRKGGKRGKQKGKEFMDAAIDAYIRHLALEKWREVTDLQESLGVDVVQAVRDAGSFLERGPYRNIWERWWQTQIVAVAAPPDSPLFGTIEAAVKGALTEEITARRQQGDALLEDTLAYKTFLDRALNHLFEEEAGSIEEM
jgi:hypothetical protein